MTRAETVAMFERRRQAMAERDARALAAEHGAECVLESPMAGTVRGVTRSSGSRAPSSPLSPTSPRGVICS